MWSAAFMVALAPLFGINEFTYEVKEFLINDLKDGKTFAFLCNFLFAYYHSSFLFKSYNETGESLSITEDALIALKQHSWPGNVRELDNIVQRAKILSLGDKITLADLIFDNHELGEQPNTADILAAKFKSSSTGEVVQ